MEVRISIIADIVSGCVDSATELDAGEGSGMQGRLTSSGPLA